MVRFSFIMVTVWCRASIKGQELLIGSLTLSVLTFMMQVDFRYKKFKLIACTKSRLANQVASGVRKYHTIDTICKCVQD